MLDQPVGHMPATRTHWGVAGYFKDPTATCSKSITKPYGRSTSSTICAWIR